MFFETRECQVLAAGLCGGVRSHPIVNTKIEIITCIKIWKLSMRCSKVCQQKLFLCFIGALDFYILGKIHTLYNGDRSFAG